MTERTHCKAPVDKALDELLTTYETISGAALRPAIRSALERLVAAQREADARICEGLLGPMWTSRECADKIREQGKET